MLLAFILVAGLTVFLCWLLFALASLALPLLVGAVVAHWVWLAGAGLIGAGLAGLLAGAATLFAGQMLFGLSQSTGLRGAVLLLFAAPAAIAGYNAAHGLAQIAGAGGAGAAFLALAGGGCVAFAAIARLTSGMIGPDGTLPAITDSRAARGDMASSSWG